MTYYSVWYYSAIHILCSLPDIKTSEDISEYLGLDLLTVIEAMDYENKDELYYTAVIGISKKKL